MNEPNRRHWALLREYLAAQRRRVALLAALVLGGVGLQLAIPQIMGRFIDAARAGSELPQLLRIAGLFLGVAALRYALTIAKAYLGENVGWTATNNLHADLAAHCLRLDMTFHNAKAPGELIERADGDVSALASATRTVLQALFAQREVYWTNDKWRRAAMLRYGFEPHIVDAYDRLWSLDGTPERRLAAVDELTDAALAGDAESPMARREGAP